MPASRRTAEALRNAPLVTADTNHRASGAEVALRPVGSTTTLSKLLEDRKEAISQSLPRGIQLDRFVRLLLVETQRNPKLLECSVGSIVGAALISAQLGLEPGPLGRVYLVPRRDTKRGVTECQLIVGYRGFADLAMRHPRVLAIQTNVVREGDDFTFLEGSGGYVRHRPDIYSEEERPMIAAWALARLQGGEDAFVVLPRRTVYAHRARSDAWRHNSGPWVTDEEAMWRKTAMRVLLMSGTVPVAVDVEQGVRVDEAVNDRIEPAIIDTLVITAPDLGDPEASGVGIRPATPPATPATAAAPATEGAEPGKSVPAGGGPDAPPAPAPSSLTPVQGQEVSPAGGGRTKAAGAVPQSAPAATSPAEEVIAHGGVPEPTPSPHETTPPAAERSPETGEQAGGASLPFGTPAAAPSSTSSPAPAATSSPTTEAEAPPPTAATPARADDPFVDAGAGLTAASSDRYSRIGLVELHAETLEILHALYSLTEIGRPVMETILQTAGWDRTRGPVTAFVNALPREKVEAIIREAAPALAEIRQGERT